MKIKKLVLVWFLSLVIIGGGGMTLGIKSAEYEMKKLEKLKNKFEEQRKRIFWEENFESAVKNYPRGFANIPAQWFMMESTVGWEKMMFIFGYANNKEVCNHLENMAKKESPHRKFKCMDAN